MDSFVTAINSSKNQQGKENTWVLELIEELSFLNTLFGIIFLVSPLLSLLLITYFTILITSYQLTATPSCYR
jgi:hypothetical protein